MGLSFSYLVCSATGTVDLTRPAPAAAADEVVRRLFPRTPWRRTASRRLLDERIAPRERPAVGVFDDGILIATRDAHLYDPAILHRRYHRFTEWPDLRLLTALSANDMFAYGHWTRAALTRRFSVNATAGIWLDDGTPDAFEGRAPALPDAVAWEDVELHVFERADR
ncbi:DUF6928 family protein [Pimelobacter simplex]|uniref:DUF6928 family protein n=1 Tax=Nocardioides simplex TaxID=2045 RepID=UPI003AB0FC53